MANPVGSPCTNVVYKQGNIGVTISRHSARFTATFPAGSSVAYVPVGQLTHDDQIFVMQQQQAAGVRQIHECPSIRVLDSNAGYAEFMLADNQNAPSNINFEFIIHRNG